MAEQKQWVKDLLAKDPDHFRKIGQVGGKVTGTKKGFAANPELARIAGHNGRRVVRMRKEANEKH